MSSTEKSAVSKLSAVDVAEPETTQIYGRRSIGPFADAEPHAKGGLGEVFRATDPALHRTVAVKRLQAHRSGDAESRRRFLVEAEVTARLEHPGIVPVYALYPDAEGGPAYAMRFVEGPTLSDAIKQYHDHPPDSVDFLRLIQATIQICQTVAFAHSRGVIHRDLKPQNVLLGKFGETLVVDWGLAKVVGRSEAETEDPISEATLQPQSGGSNESETQMGSAVGTPAYMSPEQAAGRWNVIDHRSDIYGLGAVLYTVLTGKAPIEKGDWPEMNQKIQRGQIARPTKVKEGVSRPLEAICLKAMTVEPADRYPSAVAMAADIEHWLADEPVSAFPESMVGRVRRWGKRNRTVVNAGGLFLVVSVIGLSIGAVLLQRAGAETEHQRQASVSAQSKAEAINRFLVDDLLKQADPANNPVGEQLTVRQLLDKASDRLDAQTGLDDQPEVEAAVRAVIGQAYDNLGLMDKAETHYRRGWELRSQSIGPNDVETLELRNKYVWAVTSQDRPENAETLARETLAVCTQALGENHLEAIYAADTLAYVLEATGQFAESEQILRHNIEVLHATVGLDHPQTLTAEGNLTTTLILWGRPKEAEEVARPLVDRVRIHPGPRYPDFSLCLSQLAASLQAQGRFAEAEPLLLEAITLGTEVRGADNRNTLMFRNGLSYAYEGQGQFEKAELSYLEVLADRRRVLSRSHPETQRTLGFLARLYAKQEKWTDASKLLAELMIAQNPDPQREVDDLAISLAAALTATADPMSAELLLNECLTALEGRMWVGDWLTAEVRSRYGDCLRQQGKYKDAESHLLSSAAEIATAVGVPAWSVTASRNRVRDLYDALQKPDEAAKWQ